MKWRTRSCVSAEQGFILIRFCHSISGHYRKKRLVMRPLSLAKDF